MRLYNTLSREAESFDADDGRVRMYVCGLTPYAPSHLGHAMAAVVFDVLRRYLQFKGYRVEHVQNFTDIDDKMIQAANKAGVSTTELAEENIRVYLEEMDTLNVLRAHSYPRATQEIPKIVEMIQALVEKGFAYPVNGNVYFRVKAAKDYGKLSHRSLDSMMAGARVEIDESKEDAADFALWKSQKHGEPAWDSPWGSGRPGWHIECSAMSITYLGETIDIHGGGQDLIFPHHENEVAQSEAFTEKVPFARFWMHNGFMRLGEDKMSKSLGNIISVGEALRRFSPDALRLFFLGSHYRSPLEYSDQSIEAQERAAERLRIALRPGGGDKGDPVDAGRYRDRFVEAMDDDLNTPRALAAIFDLARDINRGREAGDDVADAQQTLKEITGLLGLAFEDRLDKSAGDIAPFVDMLVQTRSELRAAGQYGLADDIRSRLEAQGVLLEDSPSGTLWRRRRS
ncbi:MAG: cysteine--tRNA ligase [Chloroflexi bacterium]|nr:cysteine--tRNA ligase [Chloroflexota bacterium]